MKFPRLLFALLLTLCGSLLCLAGANAQDAPRPELRAFWADGFNEGYRTPQQIEVLLARLHDAHCNAIFAQMRKGGDAFYASHYEPWASEDPSHFDALACLIERAHRMQPPIMVHAWINTCAVGIGTKHAAYHIAQLHPEWLALGLRGQADDGEVRKIDLGNPDAADWTFRLYLDVVRHYAVDGIHFDFVRYGGRNFGYNPVSVRRFLDSLPPGYKMKPYIPRHAQPLAAVFAAQGITILPAPDDAAWKQWRRDQVTNFVRKVYACAIALKPRLVVSAATIAWGQGPHNDAEWQNKSAAMTRVFQDWRGWLDEGILDMACPMTYFAGRHGTDYARTWQAWIVTHQYGRASAVAVGNWQLSPAQTLGQIAIARQPGPDGRRPYGVMLYSYAGTNLGAIPGRPGLHELELQPAFYTLLGKPSGDVSAPPFPSDVPLPPMPWKDAPTRGILKGFVRDEMLRPCDGALVTLEMGKAGHATRQTRRADATGFYAFVNLRVGTYRVSAVTARAKSEARRVEEGGNASGNQVQLRAGSVATASFRLSADAAPGVDAAEMVESAQVAQLARNAPAALNAAPLNASAPNSSASRRQRAALVENATVVLGTDTYPGNLYVQDARDLILRVRLLAPPVVPFQPGDIVTLRGTPALVEGDVVLDHATACLDDIAAPDLSPILPLMRLPNAALAPTVADKVSRARGTVTRSDIRSFTFAAAKNIRAEVPLAGRKDFSVESQSLLPSPPTVGSVVQVTGVLQASLTHTGTPPETSAWSFILLPRTGADVVILAPPAQAAATTRKSLAIALSLLFALICAGLWYAARRIRSKPSVPSF